MFETIPTAPPDPILGLTEAFKADSNPEKINLGVGVYKDAQGHTPVLASVKEAEKRILAAESSKGYLPIDGAAEYMQQVQAMLFGAGHELLKSPRARTIHTPGGTGALRVAADLLHTQLPGATLWLSDPTWANHPAIFEAAGVATRVYPYFDKASNGLAFDAMIQALRDIPSGDVVLLHACCHNPTGVDPTDAQWRAIAEVLAERKLLPLVDFAYQGFGRGLAEDASGLRAICEAVDELLICSSFSKNFGLYNERVGALTIIGATADAAAAALSQVKVCVRRSYSNPPAHGAQIVTTILGDSALDKQWQAELAAMRDRINGMRKLFAASLDKRGVTLGGSDNSFITRQNGMFSFSGLNKQQVERLRGEYAIYIVGSGRISVAGMTETNMDRLCDAIAAVVE